MKKSTTINAVLLSESDQSSQLINKVLAGSEYRLVYEATELMALMTADIKVPELIILCVKSPDEPLLSQLTLVQEQYPLPVVIFTESDGNEVIESAIQAGVSAYVVDGLSENRILPILRTAIARFKQNLSVKKELDKLRTTLSDRKVIDRAKGIIMAERQCTEDEAYTLLRTSAMNQNMRLVKLAQSVIDSTGLLGSTNLDKVI
jgi:response regulator NasT